MSNWLAKSVVPPKASLSSWRLAFSMARQHVENGKIRNVLTPMGKRMFIRAVAMDLLDRVERTTVAP